MVRSELWPPSKEFCEALSAAWKRVGHEACDLLAYMLCPSEIRGAADTVSGDMKQDGPLNVSDDRRTTMTDESQGTLRVYHIQNPPRAAVWYDVDSPAEGFQKIQALAEKDLRNPDVWGNVFGLSVLEDGDRVDWYDEDGDDLDTWAEKEGLWDE